MLLRKPCYSCGDTKMCYLGSGRFWVHMIGNVVEIGVVCEGCQIECSKESDPRFLEVVPSSPHVLEVSVPH